MAQNILGTREARISPRTLPLPHELGAIALPFYVVLLSRLLPEGGAGQQHFIKWERKGAKFMG